MNPQANAVSLNIEINGVASPASKGSAITLAGKPEDTNSITEPRKVVPITKTVRNVKPRFAYKLPASSIVVLKLRLRS